MINMNVVPFVPIFEASTSFTGVTGSPMTGAHQTILKVILPTALIVNVPDPYRFNSIERDAIITSTFTQQLTQLDKIFKEECTKAPVLYIMDKALIAAYKKKDATR